MRIRLLTVVIGLGFLMPLAYGADRSQNPAKNTASQQHRIKVVCFGDSITKRGYTTILAEELDIDTVMAGVAGNSTAQALQRMDKDVLAHEPDVVVIFFGTNDLRVDAPKVYVTVDQYAKNLNTMIDACIQQRARVILCTLPPINHKAFFTRHDLAAFEAAGGLTQMIADYRNAALKVGAERSLPVVDLNQCLLKTPEWMHRDGVHPSPAGNRIIAQHIAQALGPVLQEISATPRLHGLFQDHMVVQRNTTIPIWGWADPSEKIRIKASWGASAETVTLPNGTWRTKLKTPKAGGPFRIRVTGQKTTTLNDVLSGDVWLCTGQSNMDFAMSKFVNDAREPRFQPLVEYIRHEVATVNDPWIRHIEVPRAHSLFERKADFRGSWVSANPQQVGVMTATGYFFAKTVRKYVNVPIGLLECSYGGTRIQPWLSEETYLADAELKAYFEASRAKIRDLMAKVSEEDYKDTAFEAKYEQWIANEKRDPRPWPQVYPTQDKQVPATLYNGMISAIVPYAIKGALWYQGESNSHYQEELYGHYLTRLIRSWRAVWGQGDFPFYVTQLAGYRQPDKRSDLGWAVVNDQMRQVLTLPNTGLSVLHDIGEPADVHPHNKMDAGKRLALWALQQDYGVDVPAVSGPLYKRSTVVDGKMQIQFDHVGSGLMAGHKLYLNDTMPVDMPLTWFEICGADHQWKKAIAKIIAKDRVEVSHPDVTEPTAVRYAWSSNPEGANLYNKEGLPAAVFSTEN